MSTLQANHPPDDSPRTTIKYWLSIGVAILAPLMLVFMMFSDSIMNFQCSTWEFVTFECNRFDATFKSWE